MLFTVGILYFPSAILHYRIVALILLLVVSISAMLFDIFPVLLTAILSAFSWNFFFIPPTFTFHISSPEDTFLFLMYFVVALINAVLTYKIRQIEKKARDKEEKEKSIKLYNTLLNSLSHELRTPISAIIGATDTLEMNKSKLSPPEISELIESISTASLRLNRQVENLLSMSRLEAGILKPKLDWCDMNELIFSIIKNVEPDSVHHRIEFKSKENFPLCKTDRGFLEQMVSNLLYNAINHTPPNSLVTIEIDHQKGILTLTIADNGLGFPEAEMDLVFDKFYRLSHSKTGGIGLGLSIVKGFTESLNGKIKLENKRNGGAKFTIELPVETTLISDIEHE